MSTIIDHKYAETLGIVYQNFKPISSTNLYLYVHEVLNFSPPDKTSPIVENVPLVDSTRGDADTRLVAEDNAVNRELLMHMLHSCGLSVEFAENGQQVLQWLEHKQFSLILMDCAMPEMDWYVATAEIRKSEHQREDGQHIPIIAITADAMLGDREQCFAVGMDDYLC